MKLKIIEQVELLTEAELESLEFTPEELEAIEQERVPDLESITYEDIAEELEASIRLRRNRTVSLGTIQYSLRKKLDRLRVVRAELRTKLVIWRRKKLQKESKALEAEIAKLCEQEKPLLQRENDYERQHSRRLTKPVA